ncbi:MAG TPA: hypothetical protein VI685_05305, partial [Candidatus Angelobacter sp.]
MAGVAVCVVYRLACAQSPPPQTFELPKAQEVLGFLNQSIDWHRQITLEGQAASDPSDLLFVSDDRQAATDVLRLSFDFARADAQLAAGQSGPEVRTETPGDSRHQSLARATRDADTEVSQTQSELNADKAKLPGVRDSERQRLQAGIDELQSELDLAQTRSNTLHNILQFVSGASGTGGLLAQIDQLQHSIPGLAMENAKGNGQAGAPAPANNPAEQPASRREQP